MLPFTLASTFLLLSLLHLYWLWGGRLGSLAAIPEKDGRPLFTPSKTSTLLVALALFCCAVLVAALAGWIALPLSAGLLNKFGFTLSALFFLRAVGDFRWVGFFKRVRGTPFATLDTVLYSPLCLGLALGVVRIIVHRS